MRNSAGKDSDLEFLSNGKKGTSAQILKYQMLFKLEDSEILAVRHNFRGNEKIIVAFFNQILSIDDLEDKKRVLLHLKYGGEIFEKIKDDILTKKITVETAILFLQIEPITIYLPKIANETSFRK